MEEMIRLVAVILSCITLYIMIDMLMTIIGWVMDKKNLPYTIGTSEGYEKPLVVYDYDNNIIYQTRIEKFQHIHRICKYHNAKDGDYLKIWYSIGTSTYIRTDKIQLKEKAE